MNGREVASRALVVALATLLGLAPGHRVSDAASTTSRFYLPPIGLDAVPGPGAKLLLVNGVILEGAVTAELVNGQGRLNGLDWLSVPGAQIGPNAEAAALDKAVTTYGAVDGVTPS